MGAGAVLDAPSTSSLAATALRSADACHGADLPDPSGCDSTGGTSDAVDRSQVDSI